jgi:adenine/guanine phosphoribosyltransferase-like PRPP-binding protein
MSLRGWLGVPPGGPYFFLTCSQWEKTEMTAVAEPTAKSGHSVESSYLDRVVEPSRRKETIEKCVEILIPIQDEFDSIVATGISGVTIGSILAHRFDKSFVFIRKDSEKSHSCYAVEGNPGYRFLVVDDLVCSGSTLLGILDTVKRECGQRPKCRGALLYNGIHLPLDRAWGKAFREKYGVERIANWVD